MNRSTRSAVVAGLGLVGVAGLVGRTVAQQQDAKVRPAANSTAAAPVAAPGSTSIGTIDMDKVLKDYDKFKVATQNLQAEAMARQGEIMKIADEAKATEQMYAKLKAGSQEAKDCEAKITQLQGQFEAARKNAERYFTQKESETMALIYTDIQNFAKWVAQQRGMTFVIKFTDQKPEGTDPNSVMAVMSRTVLYADARVDITAQVTSKLNEIYRASGGPAPKPENPAGPQAGAAPAGALNAPAANPAAGARPAAAATAARPNPAARPN